MRAARVGKMRAVKRQIGPDRAEVSQFVSRTTLRSGGGANRGRRGARSRHSDFRRRSRSHRRNRLRSRLRVTMGRRANLARVSHIRLLSLFSL